MKKLFIKFPQAVCLFLFLSLSSCNLALQDSFEFVPEANPIPGFDMTAWEWLQTRTTTLDAEQTTYLGTEFDFMIEAIKVVDMVEEFNVGVADKTFLLLSNSAFTGNQDILELVLGTGVENVEEGQTPAELLQTITPEGKEILKRLLKYHIVDAYVDQRDALPVFARQYKFQTKLEGEDGEIFFSRDELLRISINFSQDLPSSRANEKVSRHNYVFTNGIGHIINDYVRKVPF